MQSRVLRLVAFLLFCSPLSLIAQTNSAVISTEILMNQQVESLELFSMTSPRLVMPFDHATASGINPVLGTDNYSVRYTPENGFEGVDKAVYECTESLFGPKTYITVEIRVSSTIVDAKNDYASVAAGGSQISVAVLDNDFSSEGDLDIKTIEAISGGTAMVSGDRILFTPATDFDGIAQLSYIAADGTGKSNAAAVYINVVPASINSDTLYLTHVSSSAFDIIMPDGGYALVDAPLFGSVSAESSFSYTYSPQPYSEGLEFLKFENVQSGKERYVEIQLINDQDVQKALVNDVAYASKGQSIVINAEQNDYLSGGVVVDHSDELTYVSGVFFYTPEAQFEGVEEFFYTVHDGAKAHTASINVYVGNYMPQITDYKFTTYKNTSLVLDYDVPIADYTFNVVSSPTNGTLEVNQSQAGEAGCNQVNGYQMISYTPSTDFVGTDQYSVEYCAADGSCQTISATVEVLSSDDDCHCAGADCVWAGDANGDGVVNVADLLSVGYHYGESGAARSDQLSWGANFADSWAIDQLNGENTNKVDANGDGVISVADTAAIAENYGNQDNLIAGSGSTVDKAIPVSFTVDNPNPKPGDIVTIQIHLGSDDNPVIDLHGWATSLVLPAAWGDSSTTVTFTPNQEWFGKGSPTISMVQSPTSNSLDLAMSRTAGAGISGAGLGGELRISGGQVLIDIIRPAGDEIPVDFIFPSSTMTDGSGQQYRVDGGRVTVRYQLGETHDDTESRIIGDQVDVLAYPNPTSGAITLHANNRDVITSVSLYDMLGRELYRREAISSNEHVIDAPLADGFYFAHITTEKGKAVERIEVRR